MNNPPGDRPLIWVYNERTALQAALKVGERRFGCFPAPVDDIDTKHLLIIATVDELNTHQAIFQEAEKACNSYTCVIEGSLADLNWQPARCIDLSKEGYLILGKLDDLLRKTEQQEKPG